MTRVPVIAQIDPTIRPTTVFGNTSPYLNHENELGKRKNKKCRKK